MVYIFVMVFLFCIFCALIMNVREPTYDFKIIIIIIAYWLTFHFLT